jgi:hypothetical protein
MVDRFAFGQERPDRCHPRLVTQPLDLLDGPFDITTRHQAAGIRLAIGANPLSLMDLLPKTSVGKLGKRCLRSKDSE